MKRIISAVITNALVGVSSTLLRDAVLKKLRQVADDRRERQEREPYSVVVRTK